jgi:hypothetical protein
MKGWNQLLEWGIKLANSLLSPNAHSGPLEKMHSLQDALSPLQNAVQVIFVEDLRENPLLLDICRSGRQLSS